MACSPTSGTSPSASGVAIDVRAAELDTAALEPAARALAATALGASARALFRGPLPGASGRPLPGTSAGAASGPAPAGHAAGAAPGDERATALNWALTGGEDHSLVATFPAAVPLPARWAQIGVVREGRGVLVDGQPYPGAPGWDHFR